MGIPVQLFFILLTSGLILVGAEIFVPGGILGTAGGLALFGAIILGFIAFPTLGPYVAVGIVVLVGIAILAWIKFFPRSSIGKKMMMSRDLSESTSTESGLEQLIGKEGKTASDLRPAGFALIDGRRVDVVSRGGMISRDTTISVVEVEGNRVVVREVAAPEGIQ